MFWRKQTVDVVFSDINMPKMDGIQLLSAMKRQEGWKSIPVLMITTEAASKSVVDVVRMGAFGYIKKPFTPAQICHQLAPLVKAETGS